MSPRHSRWPGQRQLCQAFQSLDWPVSLTAQPRQLPSSSPALLPSGCLHAQFLPLPVISPWSLRGAVSLCFLCSTLLFTMGRWQCARMPVGARSLRAESRKCSASEMALPMFHNNGVPVTQDEHTHGGRRLAGVVGSNSLPSSFKSFNIAESLVFNGWNIVRNRDVYIGSTLVFEFRKMMPEPKRLESCLASLWVELRK